MRVESFRCSMQRPNKKHRRRNLYTRLLLSSRRRPCDFIYLHIKYLFDGFFFVSWTDQWSHLSETHSKMYKHKRRNEVSFFIFNIIRWSDAWIDFQWPSTSRYETKRNEKKSARSVQSSCVAAHCAHEHRPSSNYSNNFVSLWMIRQCYGFRSYSVSNCRRRRHSVTLCLSPLVPWIDTWTHVERVDKMTDCSQCSVLTCLFSVGRGRETKATHDASGKWVANFMN